MTFKFYLRTRDEEQIFSKIYCRVIIERQKAEFYTDLLIREADWEENRQRTKKNDVVNQELSRIEDKLYRAKQKINEDGRELTSKELVAVALGRDLRTKNAYLLEYFTKCIREFKAKKEVGPSTIMQYQGTYKFLSDFLSSEKKTDIKIEYLSTSFIKDFDFWLSVHHKTKTGQNIQRNSINKHHSRLKRILFLAISDRYLDINPYMNFKLSTKKVIRDFLTPDELKRIIQLPLKNNRSLDRVRDIFLFSIYTGLRFSDAQRITPGHIIKNQDGKLAIHLVMAKTSEVVFIPITSKALAILEKEEDLASLPKDQPILPQISNQKFNAYIKHIAVGASVDKPLTHHIARHTFATNALNSGIPLEVVQKLLGHNNVKTTLIYAKLLHETLFKEMEKMK